MYDPSEDKIKDECGLFGIYNHPRAADMTYLGLFALQHRGEESAGIATSDGRDIHLYKNLGLVGEVFNPDRLKTLTGRHAIGHVRYSTAGSTVLKNAQPHMVEYSRGKVAIGHNGNLVNARRLRDELEAYGAIFQSTVDSEIIIHLMARPDYKTREESLVGALQRIEGAYSLVILTETELIGVRDPCGFRPLWLGKLGDSWVMASETCAFDLLGATAEREIEPGEILIVGESGLRSLCPRRAQKPRKAFCAFELVYFARPDSSIFGVNVARVRERLGEELAREHPVQADIVIPVPDSGTFAAIGFSRVSGIPLENAIMRNHYVGRTFINPSQEAREFKVRIKLNPVRELLAGKRIVVVDDSIVRGNTSRIRVQALREAGAKEVHLRISCPPHRFPCYFGIDFPSRKELIATNRSVDEIKRFLNVDSLGYLSREGMLRAMERPGNGYCSACWDGELPVPVSETMDKFSFEKSRCS